MSGDAGDDLDGIAAADARLGRPFPLPSTPLPLARWVVVRALGDRGAQVEWNLDDSRPDSPGRLALHAGAVPAPPQLPSDAPGLVATDVDLDGRALRIVRVPLDEAHASLRPAVEVSWVDDGLHLRLTAQGPWRLDEVLAIVGAVRPRRT